jgi:hypothetical protein
MAFLCDRFAGMDTSIMAAIIRVTSFHIAFREPGSPEFLKEITSCRRDAGRRRVNESSTVLQCS